MPALRDRIEDLPDLATAILDDLHQAQGLPRAVLHPEVLGALASYDWPGNVRELRNVLERALVLAGGSEVAMDHLPAVFLKAAAPKPQRMLAPAPSVTIGVGTTLDQAEQELIAITLAYTNNNRTRAAEILGIDPKTLYNKLRTRGAIGS